MFRFSVSISVSNEHQLHMNRFGVKRYSGEIDKFTNDDDGDDNDDDECSVTVL